MGYVDIIHRKDDTVYYMLQNDNYIPTKTKDYNTLHILIIN